MASLARGVAGWAIASSEGLTPQMLLYEKSFQNFSREKLAEFFASVPQLSGEQQKQLLGAKIEPVTGGLYLTPPRENREEEARENRAAANSRRGSGDRDRRGGGDRGGDRRGGGGSGDRRGGGSGGDRRR